MSGLALLMAGGRGSRMIRSGVPVPKPLVKVAGTPLIERNIQQLLKHGFDQIVVSVGQEQTEIVEFIEQSLRPLANSMNSSLEIMAEDQPLGNIGPARFLAKFEQSALIVYADNITSIDLREIFDFHATKAAEMTIAAHAQAFNMPFGEIRTCEDLVYEYNEKPVYKFLVCSAISVLSTVAMRSIPADCSFGISDLVRSLIDNNLCVSAFKHSAPWIDVNDHASLLEAETMVRDHAREFRLWAPQREFALAHISPDEHELLKKQRSVV